MATTPTTLQTLITLLRERTNTENNMFVSDAELSSYLNNSLCLLDGILISKFDDYKLTSVLVNVIANTNLIALPNDFLKFRGLDLQYNTTNPDGYITVRNHSFQKRNDYTGNSNILGPSSITYRLQGQNIAVLPAQLAAQFKYQLWYVPDYIQLVNTTDTLQSYMDSQAWYEFAVVDAAIKVLAKQNLDPSTFMAQSQELKEHILKLSSPNRDLAEPKSVVDTRGECSFPYGWNW